MKILFTTNFPAPYRVEFFNELGKHCELTVAYERKKAHHRDEKWVGNPAVNYKEVYLQLKPVGTSQSRGLGLVRYISKNKFDVIVFGGYASPAVMLAMEYCRFTRKKYYIEYDGGFYKKDPLIKGIIKKHLIRGAKGNFITCAETEKYLKSFGIPKERIVFYPFSSLHESDILERPLSVDEKKQIKIRQGISEEIAIVSVGRFIQGKGFDVLLHSLELIDENIGVYIVGGKPTQEYLEICQRNDLKDVHFVDFCSKNELFQWYKACDIFVFPTRKDTWGLVVNEAMACGLPIISSNMSIAARELIIPEKNGVLFDSGNAEELAECIKWFLKQDRDMFSAASLKKIKKYTIEAMAKKHISVWNEAVKTIR